MAEDRGLESYEQLLKLCERPDIYARFMRDLCRRADEKYNSGLFHFDKEPGVSEAPDRITPKLAVDDKVSGRSSRACTCHGSPTISRAAGGDPGDRLRAILGQSHSANGGPSG